MKIIAYSTIRETTVPDFLGQAAEVQGRTENDLISHLNSVIGWACDFGEAPMTPILYKVLRHLERTQNRIDLEVAENELERLAPWARQTNSIFALPDQTLRDPDGAILVGHENRGQDEHAEVPFPQDAIQRSEQNRSKLSQRGIPVHQDLPPVPGEDEVVLRSADEVAWRMLSLFIVAVRAESLATENPISIDQLRAKSPMAFESMSPRETQFIENERPEPQEVTNFAWRYEALYALQWAVGLHEPLKFPDDICDVPRVAETMVDQPDRQMVLDTRLRPTDELLDAVDFNGQLLWAARQAHIDQKDPPGSIDGGVLVERQHAFNWLIRLADAGWDDVDTPT